MPFVTIVQNKTNILLVAKGHFTHIISTFDTTLIATNEVFSCWTTWFAFSERCQNYAQQLAARLTTRITDPPSERLQIVLGNHHDLPLPHEDRLAI